MHSIIRSARIIGDLWPRCSNCGHIAQSHDLSGCTELTYGQCPTCGIWCQVNKIPCTCKKYIGPSIEEFEKLFMTPEEVEYYQYSKRV